MWAYILYFASHLCERVLLFVNTDFLKLLNGWTMLACHGDLVEIEGHSCIAKQVNEHVAEAHEIIFSGTPQKLELPH